MAKCHPQPGHRHSLPSSSCFSQQQRARCSFGFQFALFHLCQQQEAKMDTHQNTGAVFPQSMNHIKFKKMSVLQPPGDSHSQSVLTFPFYCHGGDGEQAEYWASLALQAECCDKPVFLTWCREPSPARWGCSTTHGHGHYS